MGMLSAVVFLVGDADGSGANVEVAMLVIGALREVEIELELDVDRIWRKKVVEVVRVRKL